MNDQEKYLLLKTVQDNNILPLTSVCNMACRFCSHRQNPPEVITYRFGHLDYSLIEELITYLTTGGPVIIGESATKIIEGEPFLHPDFKQIITLLRKSWPGKEIRITTNGSFLSREMVRFLHNDIGKIKLNISLNCASPEERVFLMSDSHPELVFNGLDELRRQQQKFDGSIVAMPHLMGRESLQDTIDLLVERGAETVRVFTPGFTASTSSELKFKPELEGKLGNFVLQMNEKYGIPIILEPPFLKDLNAVVRAIIPDSPADEAGIKQSDIITAVKGSEVISRVDAFNKLVRASRPLVEIKRSGRIIELLVNKEKGERPGVVLDYDLDPAVLAEFREKLTRNRDKDIIVITSVLAGKLIRSIVAEFTNVNARVIPVESKFFGGSIRSAGLLVNDDIKFAIKQLSEENIDLIILPGIIYDIFGKDLTGKSYSEIASCFNADLEIMENKI